MMVTLKWIMNLRIDERQKELASFYDAADDVAYALSKKNQAWVALSRLRSVIFDCPMRWLAQGR